MIRTKLGFKVLGLCALVFALMGIASSGAQGAATWLVLEGATVTEGVGGELTLATDKEGILHSKISGASVLYECGTIEAIGAKFAAAGTIANGGKIKFSKCKTKLNGALSEACEPISGTEKGVIITNSGHAALVLNAAKEELTKVLPDTGTTFATIESGKLCSIGTKVPVIGELFLKDCESAFLTHQETHLVEEGPGTKLFVISETAEHAATLLGSAFAKVKTGGVFRSFAGHAG